ncbi:BnaA06g33200D [Brassica napus]|uniref:BnaA06g33200D protein n=2 Tax=Brassica napus TaxID=3708 RepID=A0A078FMP0_BRANA|nr:BnaA06g33200D [Brassica napus]
MKVINLLSRGIAVDSINGGENEDEPEKKKEIDSFLLPPDVTLYFTGSFALDAAIVVGGLPRPNWREQALSRADTSIRSGSVDVIVADRALEYKMGDAHMIIQAATCLELQSMVVLKRKGSPR